MAFIRLTKCEVCGEEKHINLERGYTCDDCRNKMRRAKKLEWMNERQDKTIEERLSLIESFIYDNFIDENRRLFCRNNKIF